MAKVARSAGVTRQTVYLWEKTGGIALYKVSSVMQAYEMNKEEGEQFLELLNSTYHIPIDLLAQRESQVLSGWLSLPKQSRRKLLKAMRAYEAT